MRYYQIPFIEKKISGTKMKFLLHNRDSGKSIEVGQAIYELFSFIGYEGKTWEQIISKFNNIDQLKLGETLIQMHQKLLITRDDFIEKDVVSFKQYQNSFLGFGNYEYTDQGKICIIGVPFSKGNRLSTGQQNFPNALREYSYANNLHFNKNNADYLQFEALDNYSYENFVQNIKADKYRDAGNMITHSYEDLKYSYSKIEEAARKIYDNDNTPFFIGGDHSISYPLIRAAVEKYNSIDIIHFDAHTDTYKSPYEQHTFFKHFTHHHGNFMNYCMRLEGVEHVYQFGIRGFENIFLKSTDKQSIFFCHALKEMLNANRLPVLPPNRSYYLTFDIDFLNTSSASATATPVFNGVDIIETIKLLRSILPHIKIIGADFVEGNPEFDLTKISLQTSLYIIVNVLNLI